MTFVNRSLICVECGTEFVFTASEQEFYQEKEFRHDPKRCRACRARRTGDSVRTETAAICAECGQPTTVPFKPTQGRPVLCRACFRGGGVPAKVDPPPACAA